MVSPLFYLMAAAMVLMALASYRYNKILFLVEGTAAVLSGLAVLVSDGVTACGQEWLEDLVLHWDEEENPNLLAQRVTDEARKRRSDGHEDDITALALVLK